MRIGETYRRKGDLNSAMAVLDKARAQFPDNVQIVSTLALVRDKAGLKYQARLAYEATLRLDPRNGVALNNLAYLLSEEQDLDRALSYAQRAREVLPQLAEVSDTLGWVYLKKYMSNDAIGMFREALGKEPARATYRYHLAMALNQKGDNSAAMQELRAALKSNPARDEEQKITELMEKIGR